MFLDEVVLVSGEEVQITYNVLVFGWRQRTSDEWTGTDNVPVSGGGVRTTYRFQADRYKQRTGTGVQTTYRCGWRGADKGSGEKEERAHVMLIRCLSLTAGRVTSS